MALNRISHTSARVTPLVTYSRRPSGESDEADYAARTVITGDAGSGCSGDRFRQSTTDAFSGPRPGSLGLESGRNYMVDCPDRTVDLAIARNFRLGGGRALQVRARRSTRSTQWFSTDA